MSNSTTAVDLKMSHEQESPGAIHAWDKDLSTTFFRGGKAMVQADQLPLIRFARLNSFDQDIGTVIQILVGGKGTGKSTALARKAAKLSTAGVDIIPNHIPYLCRLEAQSLRFSEERAGLYANAKTWTQIWKLVLCSVFCFRLISVVPQLKQRYTKDSSYSKLLGCSPGSGEQRFFDEVERRYRSDSKQRIDFISSILGYVVNQKMSENDCFRWYDEYLKPIAAESPPEHSSAIFLDAVDEALGDALGKEMDSITGPLLWAAAQVGLIDAAYEISLQPFGLKIYAAIRQEAYDQYHKMGLRGLSQIQDGICLTMEYSKAHLLAIFDDNVRRTHDSALADRQADSPAKRFFGTDSFLHPRVWGQSEHPVEWLLRHTFGSPRHLVWHGEKLHSLEISPIERAKRSSISKTVNDLATHIFKEYKSQLIPRWDTRVDEIFSMITKNVLTQQYVIQIDQSYFIKHGVRPFLYLFQRGMLGYPRSADGQQYEYVQYFLPAGAWIERTELPPSNIFIIHPCLNQAIENNLQAQEQKNFVNSRFIVGHGLPCPHDLSKIRYCLTRHPKTRAMVFCYFREGIEEFSSTDILENIVESLSDITVAPTALFAGLLCAMPNHHKNGFVPRSEISKNAKLLADSELLLNYYGRGDKRAPTEHYIDGLLFSWEDQEPEVIRSLKNHLKNVFNGQVKLLSRAGMGGRESLGLDGIDPLEIHISLH